MAHMTMPWWQPARGPQTGCMAGEGRRPQHVGTPGGPQGVTHTPHPTRRAQGVPAGCLWVTGAAASRGAAVAALEAAGAAVGGRAHGCPAHPHDAQRRVLPGRAMMVPRGR